MKIRTRLSILFTILAAAILLIISLVIYLRSSADRKQEFYNHLRKEAITKVHLLLDTQLDAETLQTIYLKNREVISEVEVAIYDTSFNLLYHDAVEIDFVKETPEMIDQIVANGELRFTQEGWEVIGFLYHFDGNDFMVTAAAFDDYGHTKLSRLRNTLAATFLFGVLLLFLAGKFFARKALSPVSDMVDQVDQITATNLDLRIPGEHGRDELAELAATFNSMLDRLGNSFESQKLFVSNIAHEVRTPLTAILGEVELALSQHIDNPSHENALKNIQKDAKQLSRLTKSLLDLAKASYDPSEISRQVVRVDEVLFDARNDVLKTDPGYKVELLFDEDNNDDIPETFGNEYLLRVAFANLMENGCKFSSDQTVKVNLSYASKKLAVTFTDKGTGIPDHEKEDIFKPFFRGSNKASTGGSGIGLPLVKRIMELHKASIKISSDEKEGTTVEIRFK